MGAYLYPDHDLDLAEHFFELKKRVTTVGRHPNNDISLLLESVSRFHSRLEQTEAGFVVQDLNSSNGTYVNGERLASPCHLTEGDVITFGRADFKFSMYSPEERKRRGEDSTASGVRTSAHTSSVNIVGGEADSSATILATQMKIESTPLPGSDLLPGRQDMVSLRKANDRLLTMYKLSEVIRSSLTREEVLAHVLELIFEVLPADRGVIMLHDGSPDNMVPPAVRYRTQGDDHEEVTISRTIIQKCVEERVAILSRDAKFDSRFNASESIVANEIRSAMCVPLISQHDLLGILFVDTSESVRAFTEDDLAFIVSISNDIAMTLHNLILAEENIKNERLAAVGQTIAGLAHNIKNILQLAKGGIELMDGAINKKAANEVEAYWPVVRRGIDRMQTLTQEMLDYSRQTKPELRDSSVNEVIEDTVRSFQQDRMDPGVEMQVKLDAEVPMRKLDPDGLMKSLLNLISNAVDAFDGAGGKILVSTLCEKDVVQVRVADNGKGIPREKKQKIFAPFFTTKGSKGTGLGLSMTKKYIEDMGGTIAVESEEGRGTMFTISFPKRNAPMHMDIDTDPSERRVPTNH